jgi:hypothetical protein
MTSAVPEDASPGIDLIAEFINSYSIGTSLAYDRERTGTMVLFPPRNHGRLKGGDGRTIGNKLSSVQTHKL